MKLYWIRDSKDATTLPKFLTTQWKQFNTTLWSSVFTKIRIHDLKISEIYRIISKHCTRKKTFIALQHYYKLTEIQFLTTHVCKTYFWLKTQMTVGWETVMGKMNSRIDSIAYTRYTIWFQHYMIRFRSAYLIHDSILIRFRNLTDLI